MNGEWFLAEMTRRLPRHRLPDGPLAGQRPLARASLGPGENWLLALLESWALVGDVASFYLERIAAEGTLETAVEELSVHELIRMLGYPPRPGVAGSAWVAYTVAAAQGLPKEIEIPRRAKIQSLPLKGQLPQLFELPAMLTARVEWNALSPAVPARGVETPLPSNATEAELAGARTQVKKGLPILVGGTVTGSGFHLDLRAVEDAKVRLGKSGASTTLVSWKGPLEASSPVVQLENAAVFLLRRRARLFGYNATPWDQLPLSTQRQAQPILGGVLVAPLGGGAWQSANQGLPAQPIAALLASAGLLWAGTERGLFTFSGGEWDLTTSRPAKASISSLAAGSSGHLFAGTTEGQVLTSSDGGADWQTLAATGGSLFRRALTKLVPGLERLLPKLVRLPKAPVKALAMAGRKPQLLAAGDSGVFATRGRGGPWRAINAGLPGTDPKTGLASLPVRALAAADAIFAATEKGIFRAGRPGARWQAINEGLPGFDLTTGLAATDVLSLAAYRDRRRRQLLLLAGTDQGVFRRIFLGGEAAGPWRPGNVGLPTTDPTARTATVKVTALTVASDAATLSTSTYAGTDQGLYESADLGLTWFAVDTGQPATAVGALAVGGGRVVAATAFDGFAQPDWPGFGLTRGSLDLAGTEEEVVPGGWVALLAAGEGANPAAPALVLPVLGTTLVRREDFGLSALVTRLSVPVEVDLSAYSLRDTVVLLDSLELPLARREVVVPTPLDATTVRLDRLLEKPLAAERPVVVTGRPSRVRLPQATRRVDTVDPGPDLGSQVVTALSLPRGLEAPKAPASGWVELLVESDLGVEARVVAPAAELVWLPAASDAATLAELAWIAGCENVAGQEGEGFEPDKPAATQLHFVKPLTRAYDTQTVKILANATEVVQGETVSQTLGNGNAAQSNQSFELTNQPLTYEPAPNAAGLRSTLEVRVDGVLWQPVATFHGLGPEATVYVLRRDLAGRTRVVFGDGVRGARLPTGYQNVVATYKSGLWATPLAVDQLSLPRTRPLGVKGVSNPLPAAGATAPESMAELKVRAPRATRPLARIVSRSDFEDFALTFPGITRARLAQLATPAGQLFEITLAGVGGKPVGEDGSVLPELERAIANARLPGPRVELSSYRPLYFDVRAGLRVSASEVPGTVVDQVTAALTEAYGFDHASFGQVLASSQVLSTMRAVPGVVDVEFAAFHPTGTTPMLVECLVAEPARWRDGRVEPAELILIRAHAGITLEVLPR